MTDRFRDFSPATRARHLDALGREEWDLLVVGGGITGAGIARDAAGRGIRTALVEAGDFARGTSGASSRLVHGGLRYLETGELRLVFEALAERRRLLELAPHLVHPLPFLFPLYRGGPAGPLKLRAGMWLYDLLSLFRGVKRHRMLGPEGVAEREPGLEREGLRGGAVYHDASVDDARLTLTVARGAHEAGAAVVTHAEVTAFLRGEGGVRGASVRDRLSGTEHPVRARLVVNATGPWTDAVRRLADPEIRPRLRPTKGVHVMLRRERVGNRGAIIFRSPVDGRVMFVLPWGAFTYVGTTDTDYRGPPERVRADAADVAYLLASANGIYPEARLTPADVLSTWAGVRPLLSPRAEAGAEVAESAVSREHEVWRDRSGLVSVAGGKLTTYRSMAEEAVDFAVRMLRERGGVEAGDPLTPDLPLPGAPAEEWDAFAERIRAAAAEVGVDAEAAAHLARAYGEDAEEVLAAVAADPGLGAPLVEGLPYLWAEVPHVVRREMAVTLEDVLRRRTHLFHETRDGGVAVARAVAERMAEHPGVGWDAAEVDRQVEAYREAVAEARPPAG